MHKIVLSLGAAAAVLAGGAAYATQPGSAGADFTRTRAQEMAQKAFDRMDVNSDGALNQADHEARQKMRFDRLDTDKNGALSYDEFTAARGHKGDRMNSERRGHRGERADRGHWHRHGGHHMMGRMADADKDGSITRAEFTAAALQRFDRADADHNGTVTTEERQAARAAMRQQFQQSRQS